MRAEVGRIVGIGVDQLHRSAHNKERWYQVAALGQLQREGPQILLVMQKIARQTVPSGFALGDKCLKCLSILIIRSLDADFDGKPPASGFGHPGTGREPNPAARRFAKTDQS